MINVKDVEQILSLTKEIKKLEDQKKILTEALKKEMITNKQNLITHNGSKIQLVQSTRFTVKRGMKDKLILFLKQKNLGSCITLNPDINKDSLETEINVGKVTKEEIEQYMSCTEVNSIRVTL